MGTVLGFILFLGGILMLISVIFGDDIFEFLKFSALVLIPIVLMAIGIWIMIGELP